MAVKTLNEICLLAVIDNIDLIGDVGDTDLELLRKILLHCNVEQLQRIEDATEGRDLTPVTDELWRKAYSRKYGAENMATVQRRMKKRGLSIKWRALYDAKLKEQEETQQRCVIRLKELYLEAKQQKQSRQVQLLNTVPATGRKRKFTSLGGPASSRPSAAQSGSSLVKKARVDFARSRESMGFASGKRPPLPPAKATPVAQFRSGPPSKNRAVSCVQPVSSNSRSGASSVDRADPRIRKSTTHSDSKQLSANRLHPSGHSPSPPPPPPTPLRVLTQQPPRQRMSGRPDARQTSSSTRR